MALQYPLSSDTYKYEGKIEFTAFEEIRTDVSLADLKKAYQATSSTFKKGFNNRQPFAGQQASVGGSAGVNTTIIEKQALETKETVDAMYGTTWRPPIRVEMKDRIKSKTETTTLYLPPGLVFNDAVSYDNQFQLGVIGAGALEGLRSGRSIASSVLRGIEEAFESVAQSLSGPLATDVAKVGAVRTASRLPGGFGEGLAQTATGVTVNPNRRTIMRGPEIRSFSFQFKMIPSSVDEARQITRIIKFFRSELYPEQISAGNVGVGYKVPKKFDIRIKYGDREVASRILPCFLQTVQTVYNPSSMSFHKGGEFAEIDMTLTFTEERALNKQDITGGGYYDQSATEDIDAGDGVIPKGTLYKKYYEGGY